MLEISVPMDKCDQHLCPARPDRVLLTQFLLDLKTALTLLDLLPFTAPFPIRSLGFNLLASLWFWRAILNSVIEHSKEFYFILVIL